MEWFRRLDGGTAADRDNVESVQITQGNYGFGLRTPHYSELLARGAGVPWVEAIAENFLGRGGRPLALLERLRAECHVVLHGVSLSVGGLDPFDAEQLRGLRQFAQRIGAAWISDHLCFGTFLGRHAHDLWPLPYTEEALDHVARRVRELQERLGQRILLENVSSYVTYRDSELSEWEFVANVAQLADCFVLLDINNVVVNAKNHGFSARTYLDALPRARVKQIHLAGHTDHGTHAIDDHASAVSDEVWELYGQALRRFGPLPTIVEWDDRLPPLDQLQAEARKAHELRLETLQ